MSTQLNAIRSDVVGCRKCSRLVYYRESIAREKRAQFSGWDYWGRPVPGFGDPNAMLMMVGLAPAAHGGNRTGRVFTGDRSGDFLFSCLFKAGFANQPVSRDRNDGLRLRNVYLTAAVKCAPPDNTPTRDELENCAGFLRREIGVLRKVRVILCLGQIAYRSMTEQLWSKLHLNRPVPVFRHGLKLELARNLPLVFASYHPSPRNTQTGRLTEAMFLKMLSDINSLLGCSVSDSGPRNVLAVQLDLFAEVFSSTCLR